MGITTEVRNEILFMFDAGHTSENIADILGVSEGLVEHIVTQQETTESP